jgi:uncharacterized membrane protein/thiol-disulfide isomerase/thioredoxin
MYKFSPSLTRLSVLLLLVVIFALNYTNTFAQHQMPIVRAVLFYSPTCGYCHKVMEQDLPPLKEKYKNQLVILEINTATPEGQDLYQAAHEIYKPSRRGVPLMLVGQNILLGAVEIPTQLPELIESGLKSGGIPWPDLPGLNAFIPLETETVSRQVESQPSFIDLTLQNTPQVVTPLWLARFLQDPVGNGLAVIVLIFMLFSVISVSYTFVMTSADEPVRVSMLRINWPQWTVPVLCAAGIMVAGYLSFGEVSQTELVCGPVGDCNAVQQSPYATLWGILPVGILGMIGFAGIFSAWLINRFGSQNLRNLSVIAMWGMAVVGVLFSMYLTFLEPFVIGATCIWCITTATIITLLLWVTTRPFLDVVEEG